jgi:hypothetical protein
MPRPGHHRGYISNGPGVEIDVLGCSHCSATIEVVPPKGCEAQQRYRCGACDKPICPPCAKVLAETHVCTPFEKKLDLIEAGVVDQLYRG